MGVSPAVLASLWRMARIPGELLMRATWLLAGRGCPARSSQVLASSWTEAAWMTPAWLSMVLKACGGRVVARARWPVGMVCWVSVLTQTMGLRSESWRAMRENLRALPTDSR